MTVRADAPGRRNGVSGGVLARTSPALAAVLLALTACSAGPPAPSPTPNQPSSSAPAGSTSPAAPGTDPQDGASPSATPSGPPDPRAPKTFRPAGREGTSDPTVKVASASAREARWSDGVRLQVLSAQQSTATGSGPGSAPGSPLNTLRLRLTNGSRSAVDVSGVVLAMPYGGGTRRLAPRVYPDGAQDFAGRLEPGATGRATYAFTLPRTQRSSADLVVDLDGVHALATLEGVAR